MEIVEISVNGKFFKLDFVQAKRDGFITEPDGRPVRCTDLKVGDVFQVREEWSPVFNDEFVNVVTKITHEYIESTLIKRVCFSLVVCNGRMVFNPSHFIRIWREETNSWKEKIPIFKSE